jgi:cytochrome c peroxidase
MNKFALALVSITVLPQQEVSDIVAFLKSLTGDQPKTSVPALPPAAGTSARPVD